MDATRPWPGDQILLSLACLPACLPAGPDIQVPCPGWLAASVDFSTDNLQCRVFWTLSLLLLLLVVVLNPYVHALAAPRVMPS